MPQRNDPRRAASKPTYTNYYPYDLAKAKSLMAAAGYSNGFSMNALACGPYGVLGTPTMQAVEVKKLRSASTSTSRLPRA